MSEAVALVRPHSLSSLASLSAAQAFLSPQEEALCGDLCDADAPSSLAAAAPSTDASGFLLRLLLRRATELAGKCPSAEAAERRASQGQLDLPSLVFVLLGDTVSSLQRKAQPTAVAWRALCLFLQIHSAFIAAAQFHSLVSEAVAAVNSGEAVRANEDLLGVLQALYDLVKALQRRRPCASTGVSSQRRGVRRCSEEESEERTEGLAGEAAAEDDDGAASAEGLQPLARHVSPLLGLFVSSVENENAAPASAPLPFALDSAACLALLVVRALHS